ncbi:flagellar basal body-associated FliL family protein [Gemmobacter sp. 24YEA27]|uniref:flagellar basal body-associated FliL family protein n=1 Tax=Gemmobacter sp. 24YEA27 TaxID=3040672 RepID=UPI0024B3C4B0|nr:flagellar basal body-associated FliL family protein [Gemmobacter sp. 24YEA27]
MSDTAIPEEAAAEGAGKKRPKLSLLIGLLLTTGAGGAGFYVMKSGLLMDGGHDALAGSQVQGLPDIAYVPVDQILISLPPGAPGRHLRFAAQIEVARPHAAEVTLLMPRVLDVLNSYLRAVDPAGFDDPGAMTRLRAQMLRRIQIVTGEGRVRDLLITEFVMN